MAHLAIYGSGYLGRYRQAGEITSLALIHPDRIRPEVDNGQLRFRYSPAGAPNGCSPRPT